MRVPVREAPRVAPDTGKRLCHGELSSLVQTLNKIAHQPHPAHASAIHFYAALSHELLAKAQGPYAPTKLPLLNSARAAYLTALSLLPTPDLASPAFSHTNTFAEADAFSDRCSNTDAASAYSDADSASIYSVATDASDAPLTPDYGFAPPSSIPLFAPEKVTPRPKSSDFHPPQHLRPLKPLPLFHVPAAHRVPVAEPAPPTPELDVVRLDAQRRYHEHLVEFRAMLDRHHSEVIALIVTTMEAQAARYSARRSLLLADEKRRRGGEEDEDLRKAQLRERIERLRERGWKRERFDPSQYEDLCERALAEL